MVVFQYHRNGIRHEQIRLVYLKMSFTAGIITISDRSYRGEREDTGGPGIKSFLEKEGWEVIFYEIVPDEKEMIKKKLREMAQREPDIILTTGGTGLSPRDVTPEATLEVLDKQIPGFGELMRLENYKQNKFAILSRGVCGIIKKSIVINLPGNPRGAIENLSVLLPILPHGIKVLKSTITDCKEDVRHGNQEL